MFLFAPAGVGTVDYFSMMNCAAHSGWSAVFFGHYTAYFHTLSCLFPVCLGISIQTSVLVDPITGLSTTSSTLEYSAEKEDADAQFACSTQPTVGAELVSSSMTFTITCESPNSTYNIHLSASLCIAPKAVCSQAVSQSNFSNK